MGEFTRRDFVKGAGAVAAAAGAAAAAPLGIAAAGASPIGREPALSAAERMLAGEDVIVHLHNASTGEMSLFIGTREIRFTDRQVAARLLRAAR